MTKSPANLARRLFISHWGGRLTASLVVAGVLLLVGRAGGLSRLEWLTEAWRLQVREHWAFKPPSGRVVLLAVDERTLAAQGQWPFARSVHGQLMEWLDHGEETRPAVMAWDITFPDETYDPRLDAMFAEPLGKVRYPILMGAFSDPAARGIWSQGRPATTLGLTAPLTVPPEIRDTLPDMGGMQIPIAPLLGVTRFVLLDADADADGVIRKIPLVVRVGDRVFPGLVLGSLINHWGVSPDGIEVRPGREVVLRTSVGERRIPMDERGNYHLNYRYELADAGKANGLPSESYQDVYEQLVQWAAFGLDAPKFDVAGKILVVGQTATGLTDIGPSPLRSKSGKVLVHLNALENILAGDYLWRTPAWPGLVCALLAGFGLSWLLDTRRLFYYAGLAVVGVAVAVGSWVALVRGGWMIPLAMPAAGLALQQAIVVLLKVREEQANRDRIRRMFGAYVSPALVKRMVESGEEPKLGGVQEEITAYFSDIESFSSFSEKLSPPQLVEVMNEYLTACTDIVQAEGGTLDKYIGDAVVAMYGAPLTLSDHPHRAVVAALRVHRRCAELRAKWRNEREQKNWPDIILNLQTRIGLNTGSAVVGNMGSHTRFNYTMMGDTVNLAARMESGAKSYGVYTMVTEAVVEASRRLAPGAVLFRPMDRIVVKGRSQPVGIAEAVALREDADARTEECLAHFAEGLEAYYAQDWARAKAAFARSRALEKFEKNNPSKVLLARVEALEADPPRADWDGVYVMTSK